MAVSFPFEKEDSPLFGTIHRPIAQVLFQHQQKMLWRKVTMLVDTGADHTILPRFMMPLLGIDPTKDCRIVTTQGVGGSSKVYLLKKKDSDTNWELYAYYSIGLLRT